MRTGSALPRRVPGHDGVHSVEFRRVSSVRGVSWEPCQADERVRRVTTRDVRDSHGRSAVLRETRARDKASWSDRRLACCARLGLARRSRVPLPNGGGHGSAGQVPGDDRITNPTEVPEPTPAKGSMGEHDL
jgi:hypothetical protein